MNLNKNQKELEMKFDLNVIQHLGSKMYSTIHAAIAELIANSYDACSPVVEINFFVKKTLIIQLKSQIRVGEWVLKR